MRRIGLFVFFLLAPSLLFAQQIILRHIRVQNQPNQTRVIFVLSAKTNFRSFVLSNPNRYIIDFRNTKTYKKFTQLFAGNELIQAWRYATHRDGVFRAVFILRSGVWENTGVLSSTRNHETRIQIIFSRAHSALASVITDKEDALHHRNVIIVIDPGHGGKDPGATGLQGTKEKNVVLAISKKLQYLINQQPGYHAMLTRTGDYYLTLRQRLAVARKDKADMFIAIHADKWKNTHARGVSVFALSQRGATSEAARWLATKENASELMGGVELNDKSHLLRSVLINLSQSATIRSSLEIGADVIQSVKPMTRLHHPRVEQAAFVVLKSPDIPSLLVETGFLSNPNEENRLNSQSYQKKLASALTLGVTDYFAHYPPRNTWLSYWRNHPRYKKS